MVVRYHLLYEMLNRCVFRDDLKLSIGWLVLTASGNEFQAIRQADMKDDLWHWLFLKCAGGIALFADNLRALECVFEGNKSAIYSGDSPLWHLYTSWHSLYTILSWIFSQWRPFSNGVTWSFFLRLQITQQPIFCIHWICWVGIQKFLLRVNCSSPYMKLLEPALWVERFSCPYLI